jgi:peroxiredoxin
MRRSLVPLLAVGAAAAFLITQQTAPGADNDRQAQGKKAEIGKPAPDFELKDVYGKTFKLSDFKGKIVVLEWMNQKCPVSFGKHKDRVMQETYKKYAAKGVIWLAIDSSYYAKGEDDRVYAATMGLAYPILQDPDGKVGHVYDAKTTPHMFVIDAKGVLAYDGAIDDHGKTNYVSEAIEAVLADKPVKHAKTKPYGCSVKYKS